MNILPSANAATAPNLRGYHRIINEATGRTNIAELEAIEDCMRHDIFKSTLDWQSRELLIEAARAAERALVQIREIDPRLCDQGAPR